MSELLSKHATLIHNPNAGFWQSRSVLSDVVEFWKARGWTIHVQSTEYAEHATDIARAAAEAGHGMVMAAGGDGTLNETANGLLGSDTILAPLPIGTTNTFAKELGLPRPNLLQSDWLIDVSQALCRGVVQRIDVGRNHHGRCWLFWAGTGIDGYLVDKVEPRPRWFKRLGPAGYLAKILYVLPRFPGMRAHIQADDQDFTGEFVMVTVSNSRLFAGGELRLNPRGILDDGWFELWMFRGRDWPQVLQYSLDIARAEHWKHPDVEYVRCRRVAISTQPIVAYHLDGEPVGDTPLTCELLPQAVRILVPDSTPTGLFQHHGVAFSNCHTMT